MEMMLTSRDHYTLALDLKLLINGVVLVGLLVSL